MNYKMRRILSILCAGTLLFGLTACASSDATVNQQAEEKAQVFAHAELISENVVDIVLKDGASSFEQSGVSIDGDVITITSEGTYRITGELSNGQIVVDASKQSIQLLLDGVSITNSSSAAIYVKKAKEAYITLQEGTNNTLTTTGEFVAVDENNVDAVIFSKDDLYLNGEGKLQIVSSEGHGIVAKDNLFLEGGSYQVLAKVDAFHANENLTVSAGEYTISCEDDAIHADGSLIISDGTIVITESYEGIEGATIQIDGGDITICASDDGINASGDAKESNSIEINGGTVRVNANGDGIDSNGTLTFTGGLVLVSGPTDNMNAALDSEYGITVTGGTIIAAGSSGMAENFGSSSTQGAMLISCGQSTTGAISLMDASGKELLSFTPEKSYSCIQISCADVVVGGSYTISYGDQSQTIEMTELIYGASGGMFGGMPGGMGRPGQMERPDNGKGKVDNEWNKGDKAQGEGRPDRSEMSQMPDFSEMPDISQRPDMSEMPEMPDGMNPPALPEA